MFPQPTMELLIVWLAVIIFICLAFVFGYSCGHRSGYLRGRMDGVEKKQQQGGLSLIGRAAAKL